MIGFLPSRTHGRRAAIAIVGAAVTAGGAAAQAPADPGPLVTVEWLARHVADGNVVLLHVGDKAEYDREHIPGARFITMDDVSAPRPARPGEGLTRELPPADVLRRRLETFGISDATRVVLYWGNDRVSPTTRILLALDWAGLGDRASVLDGGMPAWKAAGQPVTAETPVVRPGTLRARPTKDVVADHATVRALPRAGVALVDARAAAFYDGVQAGQRGKLGHIPGAVSVPFSEIVTGGNRLKPAAELRALFDRAGVAPGDSVIAYCHIGQQATLVMFAAKLLGHPAKLYDGSFEDWAARDLPVDTIRND